GTAMLHDIRCGHCKAPLFPTFSEQLDRNPVGYWQGVLSRVQEALRFVNTDNRWHLAALAAGAAADGERRPWETLVNEIDGVTQRAAESLELQIQHGPQVTSEQDLETQLVIATELIGHVESGGGLGTISLAFR